MLFEPAQAPMSSMLMTRRILGRSASPRRRYSSSPIGRASSPLKAMNSSPKGRSTPNEVFRQGKQGTGAGAVIERAGGGVEGVEVGAEHHLDRGGGRLAGDDVAGSGGRVAAIQFQMN